MSMSMFMSMYMCIYMYMYSAVVDAVLGIICEDQIMILHAQTFVCMPWANT